MRGDARTGHIKSSEKSLTIWRPALPGFPVHRAPLPWCSPWALLMIESMERLVASAKLQWHLSLFPSPRTFADLKGWEVASLHWAASLSRPRLFLWGGKELPHCSGVEVGLPLTPGGWEAWDSLLSLLGWRESWDASYNLEDRKPAISSPPLLSCSAKHHGKRTRVPAARCEEIFRNHMPRKERHLEFLKNSQNAILKN